jgi:hypothetical protein
MAKATVRLTPTGTWIEIEAESVVDAFKLAADYSESFSEKECGACKSKNLRYEHRQDKEQHDYYSIRCMDCACILDFGQKKVGKTLFAKRKDKDNNWLPNKGWKKWERQQQQAAPAPAAPTDDDETPF